MADEACDHEGEEDDAGEPPFPCEMGRFDGGGAAEFAIDKFVVVEVVGVVGETDAVEVGFFGP